MKEIETHSAASLPGPQSKVPVVVVLVVAMFLFGALLLWHFIGVERDRNIQQWQIRLGIIADNKVNNIDRWIDQQYSTLSNLSDNASMQLYMTELAFSDDPQGSAAPEATFLRNLLYVTADKNAFLDTSIRAPQIGANVNKIGAGGIALLNHKGELLVSTRGMPVIDTRLQQFIAATPKGSRSMLDIYEGNSGKASVAFLVPVFAIQGEKQASDQVGYVLGIKEADELFKDLKPMNSELPSEETILVRMSGNNVVYLSNLADGSAPLTKRLDKNTEDLASVFAIKTPGVFSLRRDYELKKVFVTGRKIQGSSWTLVHKVDAVDALRESDGQRTMLIIYFVLGAIIAAIVILLAWRHGASVRLEQTAKKYKQLFEQFRSQESLLRLVSDNQPDAMFIVDEGGHYNYANAECSATAGISEEDIIGKTLESVFGPNRAKMYKKLNKEALDKFETITDIHEIEGKMYQSKHIPLARVPGLAKREETRGVLVVEQDISELITEKERRERILRQTVDALLSVVDKHNPYASNHSTRVAHLARGIAEEMELDPVLQDTAEMSGKLMNMGKVLLPPELLVKKGKLTEEERLAITNSVFLAAELLEKIDFDGPVVATLLHSQEAWDGTGPKGVKGDDIEVTARIVSASNAFIGMISPRAYRPSMDPENALDLLLKEIGTKFDRNVVASMVHYVEGHKNEIGFLKGNIISESESDD
jgi:PAS domain S-box-containing protein